MLALLLLGLARLVLQPRHLLVHHRRFHRVLRGHWSVRPSLSKYMMAIFPNQDGKMQSDLESVYCFGSLDFRCSRLLGLRILCWWDPTIFLFTVLDFGLMKAQSFQHARQPSFLGNSPYKLYVDLKLF